MSNILRKIVVFFVLLLTFISTELSAQNVEVSRSSGNNREFKDNIRLQMPNDVTIEYGINYRRLHVYKSYSDELKTQNDLKDELDNFLKRWAVLGITGLEGKEPMFIDNSVNKITISNRENIAEVEFPKDTKLALTVNGRHKLKLVLEDSDVFIYFDTIEQLEGLKEYDIEEILKGGDAVLESIAMDKKNKRASLEAWLSVNEYNQVGLTYHKVLKEKGRGYIYMSGTPIIENINGDWLAGYGLSIATVIPDKNRDFLRVGLHYDFMYNFSADKTNIAHWMDAVFSVNLSGKSTRWGGISFGYLVKQHGDFFDNHKFRIGIPLDVSSHISISPQFYFKDFLKSSKKEDKYLGVKIAYSF